MTEPDELVSMTHTVGRRRFLAAAGVAAGAGAATAVLPAGLAEAAVPSGASKYVALPNPVRSVDTRHPRDYAYTRLGDRRVRFKARGRFGVSNTATAITCTIAAVNGPVQNFVAMIPARSEWRVVSNLSLRDPFTASANLATVKLSSTGEVDAYCNSRCEIIVDVTGYYEPVTGPVRDGRYVALSTARRVRDTRPRRVASNSITTIDVTNYVPADATSAVINLAAVDCTGGGHFTCFSAASSKPPRASSLNVTYPGEIRSASVIVPLTTTAGRRKFKVFTRTSANLVIDVSGYYTGPNSPRSDVGLFVAEDPRRIADTRKLPIGKLWPKWQMSATAPGGAATRAQAIAVNLTGFESRSAGWLAMFAARTRWPGTVNLNFFRANDIVPNHVIAPLTTTHGFEIRASHGCHLTVDYYGYFTGLPKAPKLSAYVNPAPAPASPPWLLTVPRFGLNSWVHAGDPNQVTNRGDSWHWTGTGLMGQNSHVAVFGHRTEAGGPYRNIHAMRTGDLFYVTTLDRRQYTYRVTRRDLTDDNNDNILNATRFHPGATVSLIACTVGYDRSKTAYPDIWAPTSLRYRIIVTGELVSWKEV